MTAHDEAIDEAAKAQFDADTDEVDADPADHWLEFRETYIRQAKVAVDAYQAAMLARGQKMCPHDVSAPMLAEMELVKDSYVDPKTKMWQAAWDAVP